MAEAAKPKSPLKTGSLDWIAPVAAVSMVFVMLVPLPSFLLDLLLAISCCALCIFCGQYSSRFSPACFCC
jgi:flagellar biosynthesis component FlhA